MVWTYTASPSTAPGTSAQQLRDAVRLMVGDTDTTDQQLQDAEVDWFIATETNPRMAAHAAALALQGRYARQVEMEMGARTRLRLEQRALAYGSLAETLLARAAQDALAQATPLPIAGGLTDWSTGQSPDTDPVTGENLPGSYFTRERPRTITSPIAPT